MISKEEIKKWLLENCVDENGNLNLKGLDFSDFDGDVNISFMNVKNNLYQHCQYVCGNLIQNNQKARANLYQDEQTVDGTLFY